MFTIFLKSQQIFKRSKLCPFCVYAASRQGQMFSVLLKLQLIFLFSWWIHPPGDQEIFSWWGTTLFLIHQETRRFSWSPGGFKNIVPHQEKISLSPGELIHQETKRIAWSPGGLKKKGGTPPGDLENLLVSWWINSPGDQEIFSWWGAIFFLIHQETKKFFCPPGGSIHQETRRFSPGGVPYFFFIH